MIADEVYGFNPCAFHVTEDAVDAGGEVGIGESARDGDHEASGGGQEALEDAIGHLGGGGSASCGGEFGGCVEHAEDGAEEADEGRDHAGGGEDVDPAFETADLELSGVLHDGAQFFTGVVVSQHGGVEDAGDGCGNGGAFDLGLGPAFFADEVGQSTEEVCDGDGDLIEEEDALEEDPAGEDAEREENPHERAAFLEVIDHCEGD